MDDNKKQKRVINTSVVLSFVVSIFAVFSLAMFGIVSNQDTNVSYAALNPDTDTTVKLYQITKGAGGEYGVHGYIGGDLVEDTFIPYYAADAEGKNPVFCVEANDPAAVGSDHNKEDVTIDDYGLLYLLNNSFANGKKITPATGDKADLVESWVTQTAIWLYLRSEDPTSPNYMEQDRVDALESVTSLKYTNRTFGSEEETLLTATDGKTINELYIQPLIKAAKSAAQGLYQITVNKKSDDIGISEDKKFYYSDTITVVVDATDLESYDISLSGIEGAELVDGNGKVITSLVNVPVKEFQVRIPADKVTDKVQKLEVTAIGHFKSLTGYYYSTENEDEQRIVSVIGKNIVESDSTEIEFVKTPDTGMNTAQTIYFIGLIVLLCGVGIVYANAKPVQVK